MVGTHTITLTGSAIAPVSLSPTSLTYNPLALGTTSSQAVVLTNLQNVNLTVTGFTSSSGEFTVDPGTCTAPLAPKATCTFNVSFAPVGAPEARTGQTVTVTDSSVIGTHTIPLTASAVAPISISNTNLVYSIQALGTTSVSKQVAITNHQNVPLIVSSISSASSEFVIDPGTCASPVSAGGSCVFNVSFAPMGAAGARSGITITVNDSSVASPLTLTASGTAIAPISLSVTSLAFTSQALGTVSASKAVSITNHENVPLTIASVIGSSELIIVPGNCATAVMPNSTCTFNVSFAPVNTLGARSMQLTVTDSDVTGPHVIPVTGTASNPLAIWRPR